MPAHYALIAVVAISFVHILVEEACHFKKVSKMKGILMGICLVLIFFPIMLLGPLVLADWFCHFVSDDPGLAFLFICYLISIGLLWHIPPIVYLWAKRKRLGWSLRKAAWFHFATWEKHTRGA